MEPEFIIGGMTGPARGAKRYSCCFCRGDAWIGPASIKVLREQSKVKVICVTCYVSNPKVPATPETEISVSSREELVEALGEEQADYMVKHGPKMIAELKKSAAKFEPWKKN